MNLDYAFFAESATVPPDGKLYVLGGGFSALSLPALPGQASFAVVAGFRFTAQDVGIAHQIELRFVDAADKFVVAPAQLTFQSQGPPPQEDREVTVPTVTFLQPMFGEPGLYAAEYWRADRMLTRIPLRVETAPPGTMGPRPN